MHTSTFGYAKQCFPKYGRLLLCMCIFTNDATEENTKRDSVMIQKGIFWGQWLSPTQNNKFGITEMAGQTSFNKFLIAY
jgi:hypothetical protein